MSTKAPKEPVAPTRPRVNKTFLNEMKAFRGGKNTPNEKVQLTSLKVKNVVQRMNVRAIKGDLTNAQCAELQKLMKAFVSSVDAVLQA